METCSSLKSGLWVASITEHIGWIRLIRILNSVIVASHRKVCWIRKWIAGTPLEPLVPPIGGDNPKDWAISSQAVCRQTACIQEGSTTIPQGSRVQVCPKCSLPWKGEDDIVCATVKAVGSPGLTTQISSYEVTNRSEHKTRQCYNTKDNQNIWQTIIWCYINCKQTYYNRYTYDTKNPQNQTLPQ